MRQGLRFVGWCVSTGLKSCFGLCHRFPDVWCSYRTFPQTTSMVGLYRPQILEFLGIGI